MCATDPVPLPPLPHAPAHRRKDTYQCPVYTTEARFREEVFTAQLKTKQGQLLWILRGVCLFLDVQSM